MIRKPKQDGAARGSRQAAQVMRCCVVAFLLEQYADFAHSWLYLTSTVYETGGGPGDYHQ